MEFRHALVEPALDLIEGERPILERRTLPSGIKMDLACARVTENYSGLLTQSARLPSACLLKACLPCNGLLPTAERDFGAQRYLALDQVEDRFYARLAVSAQRAET